MIGATIRWRLVVDLSTLIAPTRIEAPLLVLDNAGHLLQGVAGLAAWVRRDAPFDGSRGMSATEAVGFFSPLRPHKHRGPSSGAISEWQRAKA